MGQRLVNDKLAVMNLLKRIIDKYTYHRIALPVRLILPYIRYPPFRTFFDNLGLHFTALIHTVLRFIPLGIANMAAPATLDTRNQCDCYREQSR